MTDAMSILKLYHVIKKTLLIQNPPYFLVCIMSLFLWTFNNFINTTINSPTIEYSFFIDKKNKIIECSLHNLCNEAFQDVELRIFNSSSNNLSIFTGNVRIIAEPPAYQSETIIPVDPDSQSNFDFSIENLQPRTNFKIQIHYIGDFKNLALRYLSEKSNKPIIFEKSTLLTRLVFYKKLVYFIFSFLFFIFIIVYILYLSIAAK